MNILDALVEAGLIFLIVFTPFAFGAVEMWAYTVMELTVLLLVAAWVIRMMVDGEIKIPRTHLNVPILLFICLILLQITPLPEAVLKVISPAAQDVYTGTYRAVNAGHHTAVRLSNTISLDTYATKRGLLKILTYTGGFFLVIGNITTGKQKNRLLAAITAAGFLLSVFGLIQHFTWNGKVYWFRDLTHGGSPFGPFVNKNNFAGYINLIIPVSLAMVMTERERSKKLLFAFMTVVMAVALFLSLSRGGMLAFSGAMASMGILLMLTGYEGGYKKGFAVIGVFLILLLLYLIYTGIDPVMDRIASLAEKETYLRQRRWTVWSAAAGIIRDYPLTGTGLDTFEAVFPGYQPLEASGLRWLDAHNDYIQFMAETGITGVLIALTFFGLLFKRAFSSLNNPKGGTRKYLPIGLLSAMVAFLLSIISTSNIHVPADALLFSIILAMGVKLSASDQKEAFHSTMAR
ncbi:MAG: O-antigen ligase family protein [Deltaproteobacteria bacterium]|nr:O-antigen ligase family protein [Deltaproteobacteria bacterium]